MFAVKFKKTGEFIFKGSENDCLEFAAWRNYFNSCHDYLVVEL